MSRNLYNTSVYRLVIRNIEGYGTFEVLPKGIKRTLGVSLQLDLLKQQVLDCLLQHQNKRKVKPVNWSIAWEVHPASGLPHLDVLLVFQKHIRPRNSSFDYLIKNLKIQQRDVKDEVGVGHVWITPYSPRKLNKAILDYGQKQDPVPITNLTLDTKDQIIALNLLKREPYLYLYNKMCKDPLHFNVQQYVKQHQFSQHISNWSTVKTKLKDMQQAAANLSLKSKPGFKYIDRPLIQFRLSPQQLLVYDSWPGYQKIVNYLNQIPLQGNKRPMKTMNLLITGPSSIGKTSLFHNPNHHSDQTAVQDFCAVYQMGMTTWFPQYRSGVYHMILWNEAKLSSYSYDTLLKFLEGAFVDLPVKGNIAPKRDNPVVIMTSNMTLQQMIRQKFNYSEDLRSMARRNLAVRVQNVVVPSGLNLFLLQKLLVNAC